MMRVCAPGDRTEYVLLEDVYLRYCEHVSAVFALHNLLDCDNPQIDTHSIMVRLLEV